MANGLLEIEFWFALEGHPIITLSRPILTWAALKISLDWVALTVRIWKAETEVQVVRVYAK